MPGVGDNSNVDTKEAGATARRNDLKFPKTKATKEKPGVGIVTAGKLCRCRRV